MPTARAPKIFASCPTVAPTGPLAAATTTVSPAFGRPIWVRPAYAVKPGMPRTPSAVVTGALPGSSLRTVEPFCTPYLCHPVYRVQLWMPEAGGRVDYASEHDERAMTVLGLSSKREITRTSIRVRTAMAAQTREQGRYLGGRPPYGYRLADAGPHPNKAHAAWGRRAHRLEPDPQTAHVVRWIFTHRLAGHSVARIARALNEAGIPCPSAADPERNPTAPARHGRWARSPRSWATRGTPAIRCGTGSAPTRTWPTRPTPVSGISRCSGGTRPTAGSSPASPRTRRWSARPISSPPRTSAPPAARHPKTPRPGRRSDGTCWPGCWPAGPAGGGWNRPGPNGKAAYRCRHGHTSAIPPDPARPKNAYVREDRILPQLPALHLPLTGADPGARRRRRTRHGMDMPPPVSAGDVIGYLREHQITLTWDRAAGTLRAGTSEDAKTTSMKAS